MLTRSIKQSEIPVVADIQARAFRSDAARYREVYRSGGRVGWRNLRLLESDAGEAVAVSKVFHRNMSLNGGVLPAGLIGSVAVAPEHRRRGHAGRMMDSLLSEFYDLGTPISLLFPFSATWYRNRGYGMANFNRYIEIPPRLIPDYPERLLVRRARPGDRSNMRILYENSLGDPRNNGWLSRGDWEWENRLWSKEDYEIVVYEGNAGVEGYLVYWLVWNDDMSQAKVIEWVWQNDEAWRGLAGFLSALGDQFRTVAMNAAAHEPLLTALSPPYDPSTGTVEFVFFPNSRVISGFMLRVVHIKNALRQRSFPPDVTAHFHLSIEDAQLPGNTRPLCVHIADGSAGVQELDGSPPAEERQLMVETDIATFSELYTGLVSAEQARTVGRLLATDDVCNKLTSSFRTAPLNMWPTDWF
ncbi:MAG: GNAT family N-acetyltransferase [Chloroflexota bacterium]|nr:GNAT family N-acetyltransferase [Chloroflexota bacterium]